MHGLRRLCLVGVQATTLAFNCHALSSFATLKLDLEALLLGYSWTFCKLGDDWTTSEYVTPEDKEEWLDMKRSGAGRDPRLQEAVGSSSGLRTTLRDAAVTYTKGSR